MKMEHTHKKCFRYLVFLRHYNLLKYRSGTDFIFFIPYASILLSCKFFIAINALGEKGTELRTHFNLGLNNITEIKNFQYL